MEECGVRRIGEGGGEGVVGREGREWRGGRGGGWELFPRMALTKISNMQGAETLTALFSNKKRSKKWKCFGF
jgi:hypothetical protein